MSKPSCDQLARLLAGAGRASADSAMLRLPSAALTVEVADVGPIPTPIREPSVHTGGELVVDDGRSDRATGSP